MGSKVKPVVPGLAPKLDVFLHGSEEVNLGRAAQCASVALPAQPEPGSRELEFRVTDTGTTLVAEQPMAMPLEVRLMTRPEVQTAAAELTSTIEPPAVDFSVFVEVERDLAPAAKEHLTSTLKQLAHRVRWKNNTATVEIPADKVTELTRTRGVVYVEPGQTLRGPEPVVGTTQEGPPSKLRRIATGRQHHRYGRDVLVGIIDVGGFDFAHPDFRDRGGGTRWEAIWDQGGNTRPAPASTRDDDHNALTYGAEILKEHMDAAIAASAGRNMAATSLEPQSQMAVGSHGTHVASIAAGNRGVARRARLAGVLIALRPEDLEASSSFYDSTRIADAVDYLLELAAKLGGAQPLPVSINISLGTNGHAHDTSSAVARWIDNALTSGGRCVAVAAGNAGQVEPASPTDRGFITGRVHAAGAFRSTNLRQELGWVVAGDGITDISENELEIWYSPQDRLAVEVRPPGGTWVGPVQPGQKIRNDVLANGTVLSVHSETYYPANGLNRISILLSPFFGRVDSTQRSVGGIAAGEWRVRLTGTVIRDGRFDAWIERDDPRKAPGSGNPWAYPSFFAPGSYTADRMISSLACAERILSVANVDVGLNAAHVTSSRGPTRDGRNKPDICAEGTRIVAARGFDRTRLWIDMTGTSMASPFVCGVAALMLAVAPALTSAQIQGIMLTTSVPLTGHDFAWRNDTGFGVVDAAACVQEAVRYVAAQKV